MRYFLVLLFSVLVLGGVAAHAADIALLPHVPDNATLSATKSTAYDYLVRDDFSNGFGAPPLTYKKSNSACSLNAGAGDGGSQVPSADGKCRLANFTYPIDIREFGLTTPIFHVNQSTGTDGAGKNFCLDAAHPCASLAQALAQYQKFPWMGSNYVSIDDAATYDETINWNGSLPISQYANTTTLPQLNITGSNAGGPYPTIAGLNNAGTTGSVICGNSVIGLASLILTGMHGTEQSDVFPQFGCVANFYENVTVGQATADQLHAEDTSQMQFWGNMTVTGGGLNFISLYHGAKFNFNPIAKTLTFSGTPGYANAGVFHLDGSGSFGQISLGWTVTGAVTGFGGFYITRNASLNNASGSTLPGGNGTLEQHGEIFPGVAPSVAGAGDMGTGGSVSVLTGSDDYSGAIVLHTGSAATVGQSVATSITFNSSMTNRHCHFFTEPGASAWSYASTADVFTISGSTYTIAWQNAVTPAALAINSTYQIGYVCDGGNGQ